MSAYKQAFFVVPSYIAELPGITLGFLKVYEKIFQFWNHNKSCFLSLSKLCEMSTVGKSQVCEALNYFETQGELKRIKRDGKRYFVRPEKGIEIDEPLPDMDFSDCPAERTTTVRPSGQPLSGRADYNNKNINKENNIYIPDLEKSGRKKTFSDYKKDERFMRFYDAYPKKQDPRDAYKAFKQIIGNDDELLDRVIADIEKRKQQHKNWQDIQFIKYPAVYLRKGEYESEIYNEAQHKADKEKAAKKLANERLKAQEELNERNRMEERRKQYHDDGKAYRKIVNSIPQGLLALKKSMGMSQNNGGLING